MLRLSIIYTFSLSSMSSKVLTIVSPKTKRTSSVAFMRGPGTKTGKNKLGGVKRQSAKSGRWYYQNAKGCCIKKQNNKTYVQAHLPKGKRKAAQSGKKPTASLTKRRKAVASRRARASVAPRRAHGTRARRQRTFYDPSTGR